tara:strand:- start:1009 stop:1260 length:252 start_codon:yes stop_codon:yes gene_type:complete
MTLEFADGLMRGDGVDDLGAFAIEGEYRVQGGEARMGWIKTYEGAHSVLYLGVYDSQRLLGEWRVSDLQGDFRLQPVPGGRAE